MSLLFTPYTLPSPRGGLTLANRIVVAPMCQYAANNGEATDWHLMHWGNLLNSGAAMFTIEATAEAEEEWLTAMNEAGKSAWCREHGVYPQELAQWRQAATQALAEPEERGASPQQTKQDRRRIKELERELRRKDKALAETAALLVLSKKVAAIFNRDEDE